MADAPEVREPEVRTAFNEAREAASLIPVGGSGVQIQNFAQQVDMAKWIAKGGYAIPAHLRDNVGACLAVLDISQRWGFSPYQVARLCYVVNDQLAFMAQLVVAVINKFAPLEGRLRYDFEGEGDARVCIVRGIPKNETAPLEYRTPPLGKITPKNSPLWKSDSDQQLAYLGGTRFCRRHFPEILIGIYSPEELFDAAITPHLGADHAKDVTPDPGKSLHERLKASGAGTEGFRDGVVEAGLSTEATEPPAGELVGAPPDSSPKPPLKRRPRRSAQAESANPPTREGETPPVSVESSSPATPSPSPSGGIEQTADAGGDGGEVMRSEASDGSAVAIAGGTKGVAPPPSDPHEPMGAPTSAEEYVAYFRSWLVKETDPDNAEARYDAERDMRDDLEVSIADRNEMSRMMRERVEALQ